MRSKRRVLVVAGVALGLASGTLLLTRTAGATTDLTVTLSASGTGASAVFNDSGDPVLTVGSPSDTTYARVTLDNVSSTAPTTAPTFATNNYNAGSPIWVLQFSGGDALYGYPSNAGLGATNWEVIPGSGSCDGTHSPEFDTYANVLAFIQDEGCGGDLTAAYINADGNQVSGTSDTITNIDYDGQTIVVASDVVTVANPGSQTSTAGTAITTLQLSASSSVGDSITSWSATGLPAGLALNTSTGAITGTPTTAGSYSVTVTATDAGGTKGSLTFTWLVNPPAVVTPTATYTGTIRLPALGMCLDDALNSSASGATVQVWRCNGSLNQQWQVMSNGTIQHNGLCLDAHNSGVTSGTRVQLWACTGNANQQWDSSSWHIHYNNPAASNQVLDDTGWGGSGTQQEIYVNNGGANQVWQTW
jgi:Ricin-type beta-trefoil lectin domain/Putative Ig domain